MFWYTIIFSLFHGSLAILGCVFNVIVLYLAAFKTPAAMASYTILLINVAITDLLACFVDLFTQQRHIPTGFTLAYTSHGLCTFFGPHFCFLMYSIDLHFLSHGLSLLLLGFSYRFYILFHPSPTRKSLQFIIFLIYLPQLFQCISFLWAYDDPEEVKEILKKQFPNYNLDDEIVSGTIDIRCFSALYTILIVTVPISPFYIMIIMLRSRIINKLSQSSGQMSQKTKEMHTQLLKALTYQALIPCTFSFSVISYVICTFYQSHPIFEHITLSSVMLMPVLSPCSSLFFIQMYRRRVIKWYYNIRRKKVSSEVQSENPNQRRTSFALSVGEATKY